MKTRLEFRDGTSQKFWEIKTEGKTHSVTYGRLGTKGQSKTKSFATAQAAQADAQKQIKSKLKKGYAEVAATQEAKNASSSPSDLEIELAQAIADYDLELAEELLGRGARYDVVMDLSIEEYDLDGAEGLEAFENPDDPETVRLTGLQLAELCWDEQEEIDEVFGPAGHQSAEEAQLRESGIPHRQSAGHAPGFCGKTFVLLICGNAREVPRDDIESYRELAATWAKKTGLPLVAVPAGTEMDHSSAPTESVVAGLELSAADADEVGSLVPPSAIDSVEDLAAEVPAEFWDALAELDNEVGVSPEPNLPEGQKKARGKKKGAAFGVHLTCSGPLAYGSLVLGIPGGPALAKERGQTLLKGQDTDQRPHLVGVVGQRLSFVQMESPHSRCLDLPSVLAQVEPKPDGAELYLIARYD